MWCNPSTWEVERGGSKVHGHPWLNRKQAGTQEALAQTRERKAGRQAGRKEFCTVFGKDYSSPGFVSMEISEDVSKISHSVLEESCTVMNSGEVKGRRSRTAS